MKTLTISMELTEAQARMVSENSIERVINTALLLIREYESLMDDGDCPIEPGHDKLCSISIQDLYELKQPITYIWNELRNQIFIAYNSTR